MRTTIFATATTLLIASAGVLAAQDAHAGHGAMRHDGHGQHGMQHCPMHAAMTQGPRAALQQRAELGLSADQVQRLEAAYQRMHQAHQQTMPQMQDVHRQLGAATAEGRFDEQAARAALQSGGQLHTDMMLASLRAQHETHGVLTAQQRTRLAEHAQHHGGAMHGEHGQQGGHGGGMMMQCPMMGGGHQHGEGHQHQGQQHRHDR